MRHTIDKPQYDGSFEGQVIVALVKFPTGKRFPLTMPDGKEIWMQVKEQREVVEWAWTGTEWVDGDIWRQMRSGRKIGSVVASKHDELHKLFAERQRRSNKKSKKRKN